MGRKVEKKKEVGNPNAKWMSIVLLVIMLLSVVGFAFTFSSGGGSSGSENNLPDEVPLQQYEQNGQVIWFTIRNSEVFAFESIDPLIEDRAAEALASRIESSGSIDLYVDSSFTSLDSLFLIEKAFVGERINVNRISQLSCNSNTLVLSSAQVEGECMNFIDDSNSTFSRAEALVYHIVKE